MYYVVKDHHGLLISHMLRLHGIIMLYGVQSVSVVPRIKPPASGILGKHCQTSHAQAQQTDLEPQFHGHFIKIDAKHTAINRRHCLWSEV